MALASVASFLALLGYEAARLHEGSDPALAHSKAQSAASASKQSLVPFATPYRPLWTGLGILAAYLAALLGLSYYARRTIGARRRRRLHRITPVIYVLAAAHMLGAGSDGSTLALRLAVAATAVPIAALLALRLAGAYSRPGHAAYAGSGARSLGSTRPPA